MASLLDRLNMPASLDEAILLPLYALALALQTGVFAGTLWGVNLNAALFSLGGTGISWTILISESVVVAAVFLFEIDTTNLNQIELWSAILAVVIPLGIAFVPALKNFLVFSQSGSYVGPTTALVVGFIGISAMTFVQESSTDKFSFSLSD